MIDPFSFLSPIEIHDPPSNISSKLEDFYCLHQRLCEVSKRVGLIAVSVFTICAYRFNVGGFKNLVQTGSRPMLSLFDYTPNLPDGNKGETQNLLMKVFLEFIDLYKANVTWYTAEYVWGAFNTPYSYAPMIKEILNSPDISKEAKALAKRAYKNFVIAHQKNPKMDLSDSKDLNFLYYLHALPTHSLWESGLDAEKQVIAKEKQRLEALWDSVILGQDKVKESLIAFCLQQAFSTQKLYPNVLGITGPFGTGKTTFALDFLSKATTRPLCVIPMSSISSVEDLLGSGEKPGLLSLQLSEKGVLNPIFIFDELDKVQDPQLLNLFLIFSEENYQLILKDRYAPSNPLDISKASFIYIYNNPKLLPPALVDRLHTHEFQPLTLDIKQQYLRSVVQKLLPSPTEKEGQLVEAFISGADDTLSLRQLNIQLQGLLQRLRFSEVFSQ